MATRLYKVSMLVTSLTFALAFLPSASEATNEGTMDVAGIQIIYFHAEDDPIDENTITAFDEGLENVRRWYGERLGRTFIRTEIKVVSGEKTTAEYCAELPCQPTSRPQTLFWAVVNELRGRGYINACGVYLIAIQTYELSSTMGNPGGTWYSDAGGGIATFGKRELTTLSSCLDCRERRAALGLLAHELGHAFNLPHPENRVNESGRAICDGPCEDTIMWNYAAYPEVGFLDSDRYPERTALAKNPHLGLLSYSLDLKEGWNLISLPVAPENSNASLVFASLGDDLGIAYSWDAQGKIWRSYAPGLPSDLSIGTGDALWLWLRKEAKLTVFGFAVKTMAIQLTAGWSLVGHSFEPLSLAEALARVDGKYEAIYTLDAKSGAWLSYFPGQNQGDLTELDAGRGYWLYANQDFILSFASSR